MIPVKVYANNKLYCKHNTTDAMWLWLRNKSFNYVFLPHFVQLEFSSCLFNAQKCVGFYAANQYINIMISFPKKRYNTISLLKYQFLPGLKL